MLSQGTWLFPRLCSVCCSWNELELLFILDIPATRYFPECHRFLKELWKQFLSHEKAIVRITTIPPSSLAFSQCRCFCLAVVEPVKKRNGHLKILYTRPAARRVKLAEERREQRQNSSEWVYRLNKNFANALPVTFTEINGPWLCAEESWKPWPTILIFISVLHITKHTKNSIYSKVHYSINHPLNPFNPCRYPPNVTHITLINYNVGSEGRTATIRRHITKVGQCLNAHFFIHAGAKIIGKFSLY